jgi:predicted Zn-dependent peptidase
LTVLASVAVLLLTGFPAGTQADHLKALSPGPREMKFQPVRFTPPEPARVVLENGMVVYLLEDHELPLITMTATLRAGGWLDPPDKIGLASLVGLVMRTGGTARQSAEGVDEELERLSARISVGIGPEAGGASLDVLKKDFDRGLEIFADILMTPAFDPARVELAKLQAIEGIRRRQDQPQSIAGREFSKLLYGPNHPLARESSIESVSPISRNDLLAFHAAYIHPNGVILGVTGDFDKGPLLAALRKRFGGWASGPVPVMPQAVVEAEEQNAPRVVRFIGKGTTQTHVRAGHRSVREHDPDYPALSLLNDILGGSSFRSRLFQDVRTKRGLAYSVSSVLRPGTQEPGAWLMRAETQFASTSDVIDRLIANLERLRTEPVSDAELEEAKEAFINSFVFSFTSPSAIVSRLIAMEYDGLPKDFLQQVYDKTVAVTKEELLRVARTHLHPDRLKILVVGPREPLPRLLSTYGDVKEIKLKPEG